MLQSRMKLLLPFLSLVLLSLACNLPFTGAGGADQDQVEAGVAATLTQEALSTRESALAQTEAALAASEDSTPTPEPSATPRPSATVTSTVEHQVTPRGPATSPRSFILDVSSKGFAPEGRTVGDQFTINRFERPFTSQDMQYRGYLDITKANLHAVPPFTMLTIFVEEPLPDDRQVKYGVELDTDIDGRGDMLVMAELPPDTEWTTQGVRVLRDADGDVGGEQPLQAETPDPNLTGYEEEVFNSGRGPDPDLAWIRRDPEAPQRVQIAYKQDMPPSGGYLFNVWSDEGVQEPPWFDYNDHWTFEDAGSPLQNSPQFPLKELALVDTTCRAWVGFIPTGSEPGICSGAEPTATPERCYLVCSGPSDDRYCSDQTYESCPEDLIGEDENWDYCLPCSESEYYGP